MNAIIKGIAALFAVVMVGQSGAHLGIRTVHRGSAGAVAEATDRDDNPLRRGRGNLTFPAPPPPVALPEAPVAAAQEPLQSEPVSQLPIAVQAAAPPPPPPAPAPPSIMIGSTQQALINQDRAAAGLGALNWSPCLAGIAYQNAVRMANQDLMSHAGGAQADLGCGLGGQTGENVGWTTGGINDGQLNSMFLTSPAHRANIMGPFRFVGTAWATSPNGHAYIAVEFS